MKSSINKFLVAAVILLLLINIAMLVFMLKGRKSHDTKRPGTKGGPIEMMIKELNMTEQQQKDFSQLKEEHFKKMRPLADSIRAAKQAYFSLAKEEVVNDSLLNVYNDRIRVLQTDADKMTLDHFRTVRKLFNGEQQVKFDSFIQKMMQRGPGWKKDSANKDKKEVNKP